MPGDLDRTVTVLQTLVKRDRGLSAVDAAIQILS
jgi:hypothetical protein